MSFLDCQKWMVNSIEFKNKDPWMIDEVDVSITGLCRYKNYSDCSRSFGEGTARSLEKLLNSSYSTPNLTANTALNSVYGTGLVIKNVIFNDPATIVFWTDGTKTVVKCQDGDTFDPEKGLAMAFVKKIFGNNGSYYNQIKKWTDKYYEEHEEDRSNYAFSVLGAIGEKMEEAQNGFYEALLGRGSDIDGESKR